MLADRNDRAIAGLSMGGAQTLNIALADLKDFGYVGVFSSGLLFRNIGRHGRRSSEAEARRRRGEGRPQAPLVRHRQGGLPLQQTRRPVDLLKKHGFNPVFKETRRRPHLDQLARLPERVRAAAVPMSARGT